MIRRSSTVLTGIAAVCALVGASLGASASAARDPAPTAGGAVDGPGLLERVALPNPAESVSVMLELDAEPAAVAWSEAPTTRSARITAQAAIARVERLATGVRRAVGADNVIFEATNVYAGVAVRASSDDIPFLSIIPGVKAVHAMVPKERDNFIGVPLIGSPAAWTGGAGTGAGVTIGIIDSGIDYTHAAFGGPGTVAAYQRAAAAKAAGQSPVYPDPVKVAGGYDFAGDAYDASEPATAIPQPDDNPLDCDVNGHGTHVGATAAGYGVSADGSTYRGPWDASTPFDTMGIGPGVAPAATLYAIKVFGCEGSTDLVVDALDWAMDPNGDGDFTDHLDVVNMSLGSPYGSVEDPDSVATNNAVEAGIAVIASAGNSGDTYEITGSPGVATKALSVAASEDNGQIVDGFRATIGGSMATYPASLALENNWSTASARGSVVEIGDWDTPPGSGNNPDGCEAFSPEESAKAAGNIVLLQWDDNDVSRRCGSAGRVGNAADAGAIGAILGGAEPLFSLPISGDARIPSLLTLGSTTDALHAALATGTAVTATIDGSLRNSERLIVTGPDDPTDMAANFTSRGTALAGNVKPDVSAPGGSIFSAAVGTGNQGITYSGTSMAAPMTAGTAALVLAAHPTWNPQQVKAAIMNTADHDLFLDPARSGLRYDNLRMGSGRIDAQRAVTTDAVAYVVDDPGAVSVSFGVMNVAKAKTAAKQVRIKDLRTSGGARSYAVALSSVNALPGATYSVSPRSVSLSPGASAKVTVKLTLDPTRLIHKADPTIALDPMQDGTMRDFLTDATSLLEVTPARGDSIRVPVFSAPRPASTLAAPGSVRVSGDGELLTGSFALTGSGVDISGSVGYERQRSRITALQLMGESAQLPYCTPGISTGCVTTRDDASADIRYVGFTSDARVISARGDDPLSEETPGRAYIGIASWQPWRSAAGIASFAVYLDTNNDGTADLLMVNSNLGQDVFAAIADGEREGDNGATPSIELINNVAGNKDTAKLHGNVMTLPINLAGLANPVDAEGNALPPYIEPGRSTISYWIEAYGPSGKIVDVIGYPTEPLRSDVLAPALTAFTGAELVPAPSKKGTNLTVTMDPATAGANPRLLLMHHLNTLPRKAQVVTVTR